MVNSPWSLVLTEVSPGLSFTGAAGNTSWSASVAVPTIVPVLPWAPALAGQSTQSATVNKSKDYIYLRIICAPVESMVGRPPTIARSRSTASRDRVRRSSAPTVVTRWQWRWRRIGYKYEWCMTARLESDKRITEQRSNGISLMVGQIIGLPADGC